MKKIYIVDGSAYIYRAYHAIAPLTNIDGVHTNAVFGFVSMVKKLLKEYAPEHLVVTFDSRGPVFRHEMYDQYKANRPPMPADLSEQIPYIKEYTRAAGIPLLEEQGIEADDIIASIAKKYSAEDVEIVVVSGDKDLLQLVGGRVFMFDPMKDKLWDVAAVEEKYTVSGDRLLDLFAMIGDSADNVPGIPGVGPKTAQNLIAEYGSLDGLYENIESQMKKSKTKEKIMDNRDLAFLSRDLIRLKSDVAIPQEDDAYLLGAEDDDLLNDLYIRLGFTKFLKKEEEKAVEIPVDSFFCVQTAKDLKAMVKAISKADALVIDTETTSLDARLAKLVGISLCVDQEKSYYIPMGHLDAEGNLLAGQLAQETVIDALRPLLENPKVLKIGHNIKYDWTVMMAQTGIDMAPVADTMVAAHLLEKGRSLKLDDLCAAKKLFLTSFDEVVKKDKRADAFAYVDVDAARIYACEDVYGTLTLWQEYGAELAERGLDGLFYDYEMKLVAVLARMEMRGIEVDEKILADLGEEFEGKIKELEDRIYAAVGHEFNINSPKQLGVILFEELNMPHGRKTKTGYSTDVKVLEKLALSHPVPALILEYRSLAKLKSTYVDKLIELKAADTGRIHTSFNQTGTATGRLSSSNPNMQNIPIRTEEGNKIRAAFVPKTGCVFLSADYSQIDLRVLAHYSGDKALTKAFHSGEDIHARTAAELFSVSPLLVNKEMRRVAKSINFGIVYGMSAFGLSTQLDISRKDAARFIEKYFHLYGGVQDFMSAIVEEARKTGSVSTILGRPRKVVGIDAKSKTDREFAERMAINTPIQGSAADIIKAAMIRVEDDLATAGLSAQMLLQIHDELVFEVPEAEVEKTKAVVVKAMEEALPIDVPLVVNCEVGKNLAK